jgi:hypothetical protein
MVETYGHWFVAGQGSVLLGQQTEMHLLVPLVVTVVELVPPDTVPGSPDPVSPVVPCQSPSTNPVFAVSLTSTVPSATQTVWLAAGEGVPPATVTVHHAK